MNSTLILQLLEMPPYVRKHQILWQYNHDNNCYICMSNLNDVLPCKFEDMYIKPHSCEAYHTSPGHIY